MPAMRAAHAAGAAATAMDQTTEEENDDTFNLPPINEAGDKLPSLLRDDGDSGSDEEGAIAPKRTLEEADAEVDDLPRTEERRKAHSPADSSSMPPVRNLTSSLARSEIQMIRHSCRDADLVVERAQRVFDELEYLRELSGTTDADNYHLDAFEFSQKLELVLSDLEDVEIEDVAGALGFVDRTILDEVQSTHEQLKAAIEKARLELARMDVLQTTRLGGREGEAGGGAKEDEDDELGVGRSLLEKFANALGALPEEDEAQYWERFRKAEVDYEWETPAKDLSDKGTLS